MEAKQLIIVDINGQSHEQMLEHPVRAPIQERIGMVLPTTGNPLLVATVQHTGTNFTLEKLGGLEQRPLRDFCGDTPLAFAHLDDYNMALVDAWDGPIITTYRDPMDCMQSWRNRGRKLDAFYEQWRNWFLLMKRRPIVIDITHRRCSFELDGWERKNSWHDRMEKAQ